MPLRWIEVENYRAIAIGKVTFGDTTVLFGENDSGRTSILEALLMVLGPSGETMEDRLRPSHFHRDDGRSGSLHIRLGIEEPVTHHWELPQRVGTAIPRTADARQLVFDFRADLDPDTEEVRFRHDLSSSDGSVVIEGGADTREWLLQTLPVLWMEPGLLTGVPETADRHVGLSAEPLEHPALVSLARHHRNILTGSATDMAAELDAGVAAARIALEEFSHVFAGSEPVFSALVTDILDRSHPASTAERPPPSTGAQKIAVLLVLGAMLQVVRQVLRAGPLPAYATPILVIENPEVNLHPITLAAVWRTIESVTWQKIVATHSDAILAEAPLTSLRRLSRREGLVREWVVDPNALRGEALRKVSYHVRSRRASAMFARCWLLVEGETEYWVLPELARVCGYDLDEEGVACVEFAQAGVAPLATLAEQLGIAWHVMVDGDEAGRHYADAVRSLAAGPGDERLPLTVLGEADIERCFWGNGFADVIRAVANVPVNSRINASKVIHMAIEKTSKPFLALSLVDAVAQRGPDSVPRVLRKVIERAVELARS